MRFLPPIPIYFQREILENWNFGEVGWFYNEFQVWEEEIFILEDSSIDTILLPRYRLGWVYKDIVLQNKIVF